MVWVGSDLCKKGRREGGSIDGLAVATAVDFAVILWLVSADVVVAEDGPSGKRGC